MLTGVVQFTLDNLRLGMQVGTINAVHAVLDNEGSYPLDGYLGLIQPGQESSCPYNANGCTNTGGKCDLGTTLQIGYQSADGSGDAGGTQTVTGYNGTLKHTETLQYIYSEPQMSQCVGRC